MQVKAKVKCYIDNSIREEGEIFEYAGGPDPHLTPLDVETPKQGKRGKRTDDADVTAE